MIEALSNYIAGKVKNVTGVTSSWVHEFDSPAWEGYPAISIFCKSWQGKFLTNTQHERTVIMCIRIYQDITKNNIGAQASEDLLRTLSDNIITSFDNDNKLGLTDTYTLPISGSWGWVQAQPIRTVEVDIECRLVSSAVG